MSPIDDLTYDLITVLHNKAKALEAYDKYLSDADAEDDDELRELFTDIRKQDEEHVQMLKEVLAQRLAEDLGYEDDEEDDEDYEEEEEGAEGELDEQKGETRQHGGEPADERAERLDAAAAPVESALEPPPHRGESTYRHR